MTQPDYVPVQPSDRVRPSGRLEVPGRWLQDRPGELLELTPPAGERFGVPGPDLGYGLKLAKRFEDRFVLSRVERREDALAGGFACGSRRAARFGRAPVIHDFEWAFSLWGFLGGAPGDLLSARAEVVRGVAHDYWRRRAFADTVTEEALALTPAEASARIREWQNFLRIY